MILKDCQDRGGIPVLIDTENAANWSFLKLLGIKEQGQGGNLVYLQPETIEEVCVGIE